MMKTKKTTGKFVSVLSVVLALAMLSTTVFASGFANAYFNTKEKVEVFIDGSGLTDFYENTPFLESNTPYLPLRETFRIFVFDENILSWGFDNDYKTNYVQINIPQNFTNRDSALDCRVYINRNNVIVDGISYFLQAPTILRNDITYVPYEFFQLIVAAQPLDGSSRLFNNLSIYDKDGNPVDFSSGTTVITSQYENTTPEYTVDQFFQHLEQGQVEQANRYCTSDSRIDRSFGTQKRVSDITVDYTIDSFGQISAECYAEFIDEEHLVDDYQPVHWKIYLVQQPDNTYLINGWESLDV